MALHTSTSDCILSNCYRQDRSPLGKAKSQCYRAYVLQHTISSLWDYPSSAKISNSTSNRRGLIAMLYICTVCLVISLSGPYVQWTNSSVREGHLHIPVDTRRYNCRCVPRHFLYTKHHHHPVSYFRSCIRKTDGRPQAGNGGSKSHYLCRLCQAENQV